MRNAFCKKSLAIAFMAALGLPSLAWAAGASDAGGASANSVWNPHPEADDVMVPMPCGGQMAFRKIYTANDSKLKDRSFDAGSTNAESLLSQAPNHRYIQGAFHDENGYYYLLAKYELTQAQYKILNSYDEGKGKCANTKYGIKDRIAQGNLSWFDAVELTRQFSYFLASKEAEKAAIDGVIVPKQGSTAAFARLPTDSEWEFAARGGLAVTSSQFNADVFPMGSGSGADGNIADYAWYKGQDSAPDGKVRVVGLKQPNPLGLYDILGNVNEIILDPFYATRTGRLHGQSGGFIVRGGSVSSTKADMTTAYRSERSYFSRNKETVGKDTGMRVVLSLPFTTSIQEVRALNDEVQNLGTDADAGGINTVATLDKILKEQQVALASMEKEQAETAKDLDALLKERESLEKNNADLKNSISTLTESLTSLRGQMIEANTKRDEMRDRAIISSLRLGGYLCSGIASQQIALERNAKNEQIIRKIKLPSCRKDEGSEQCKTDTEAQELKLKQNRDLAQSMVDFYVSYYADHINDILSTFEFKYVEAQRKNAQQSLGNQRSSLEDYISLFVDDVKDYQHGSRNLRKNYDKWIKQCRGLKK